LSKHYSLVFLHDFLEVQKQSLELPTGANRHEEKYFSMFWSPDFTGMVESVICSFARRFVGSYLSTFSSHISRIRGYHEEVLDKHVFLTTIKYTGNPQVDENYLRMTQQDVTWHRDLSVVWKYNDWQDKN